MKRSVVGLLLGMASFALGGWLITRFMILHESRVVTDGIPFNDPAFHLLPAADVSIAIFSVTYGSILLFLITNIKELEKIAMFGFAAGILQLFRIVTMFLIPLEVPEDLVPLSDPFLNELIYPGNITADLFFSGHTATVFILYFVTKRWWFLVLGVGLMVLLMIQRVHYSIDVLAAIPFAFLCVWIVRRVYSTVRLRSDRS